MIRMSLLGAGRIGHVHAKSIKANTNADLCYIADINDQSASHLAKQVNAKVIDFQTAITADDVDAVVIATSTHIHAELSHIALTAGKAVFCEKPIDLDLEKTTSVVEHVQESGLPYFVGFNRRFDPSFQSLHRQLKEIGKLEQLLIISRDPTPPSIEYIKSSGGFFHDMTIHDFDMALWLMQEPIKTIHATASCQVDTEIGKAGDIDTSTVVLTTESDAQCVILNSRRAVYGYDQRIEAFAAKGILSAHNIKPTAVHRLNASGERSDSLEYSFLQRYNIAFQEEMNQFIDALINHQPMPVTATDSMAATKLANAAYQSLEKGRPVNLIEN